MQSKIKTDGRNGNQDQLTMRRQCRQQKHQGKRNGNQRGPHLRDFFRAELVGQATGQRRGERPGGTRYTKTAGYRAAHLIVRQQHDRKR